MRAGLKSQRARVRRAGLFLTCWVKKCRQQLREQVRPLLRQPVSGCVCSWKLHLLLFLCFHFLGNINVLIKSWRFLFTLVFKVTDPILSKDMYMRLESGNEPTRVCSVMGSLRCLPAPQTLIRSNWHLIVQLSLAIWTENKWQFKQYVLIHDSGPISTVK